MNKFLVVLAHTYKSKLKTKSFLFTTIITIGMLFLVANLQNIIEAFSDDENEIAVIDTTNTLLEPLKKNLEAVTEDTQLVPFKGSIEKAKKAVENDDYKALLVITLDEQKLPKAAYYANNVTEMFDQTGIEQQLEQIKTQMVIDQAGMDPSIMNQIQKPVSFEAISLDQAAKTDEELNQARGIIYIMIFLLYFTILLYGGMIATDVATEKSSRVMELIVSSVSPVVHMFGKITGIALLGMTQVILFMLAGFFILQSKQAELTEGVFEYLGVESLSISLVMYAIVFFLLGYLLYATLAAMLGSLVSRVEDVQSLITPMTLLIVVAFLIAMFGLGAPTSKVVTISSYIPFFSPMLMFLRVGMLDIPIWEVAISIGILVFTILLLGTIGARIYKGGVLMYGPSSSLKDLKRAFQLSKKK